MHNLPNVLQVAEQQNKIDSAGQNDIFGLSTIDVSSRLQIDDVEEWSEDVRLKAEKETLGLYLTGHPFDSVKEEMSAIVSGKLSKLVEMDLGTPQGGNKFRSKGKPVTIAGLILEVRIRLTKRGSKIATIILDDGSARLELVAYTEVYEQYREMLLAEHIVVISGGLSFDDFAGQNRVSIETVLTVEQAREKFAKNILVELTEHSDLTTDNVVNQLHKTIAMYTVSYTHLTLPTIYSV